jgi:tRNA 2-thiouridine synthesizing protein A
MTEKIDARGLSCPQPVVAAHTHMNRIGSGTFEIVVDTATAQENISRMAAGQGWDVAVQQVNDDFILTLHK